MGRNTHIRSHRLIPKRAKTSKPRFDWYQYAPNSMYNGGKKLLKKMVDNKEASTVVLNGCLMILPWVWYALRFGVFR